MLYQIDGNNPGTGTLKAQLSITGIDMTGVVLNGLAISENGEAIYTSTQNISNPMAPADLYRIVLMEKPSS